MDDQHQMRAPVVCRHDGTPAGHIYPKWKEAEYIMQGNGGVCPGAEASRSLGCDQPVQLLSYNGALAGPVVPLPEDGGADADYRGTVLKGDFPVPGHADRELPE